MKLGNVWNARYLLPFYICLPLGIALFLTKTFRSYPVVGWLLLCPFLVGNAKANWEILGGAPRGAQFTRTTELLMNQHYNVGYADYWLAYQINALSNETIILAPTGSNDRYKPYLDYVQSQKNVIVLGQDPAPLQSLVAFKGVSYRVVGADVVDGFPVMKLEKV